MNGSRILNPFGKPFGTPGKLSRRTLVDKADDLEERQQLQQGALKAFVGAFTAFMRLGFFGRVKWLLFGAKFPKAKPETVK